MATEFVALLVLLLAPAIRVAVSQRGFLSIDCGLEANFSGYTDETTGISYVSDAPYVDTGENHMPIDPHLSSWPKSLQTLRSFPSGVRNCYSLPTVAGTRYLVRAQFAYGNYDGKNSLSVSFELHLGANLWVAADVSAGENMVYEAVFVAWAGWAPVCLVNTGSGTPFVSALELRQLADGLYPPVTPGLIMSMYDRRDMGTDVETRYPDDPYDRFWWPSDDDPQWRYDSTKQNIETETQFAVPKFILRTAVVPANNGTVLNMSWNEDREPLSQFLVFLHFADFQGTQTRQFDIYINKDEQAGRSVASYSPLNLHASCVYTNESYKSTDGTYNITLVATAASELPPIINAFEIYSAIRIVDDPTTFPRDFDAIMSIKIEYGVKKNWMGDPCFPYKYAWEGVKCSNDTMRITSLDLSDSSLHGAVSINFTLLTALENLDLSYNDLSGSIPDSLPNLPHLRVLNLSCNHLNVDTVYKNYSESLVFRYDSDSHTCNPLPPPSSRPRNKVAIIVVSVVVPVLLLVVLVAYLIWRREKTKTNPNVYSGLARDPQLQNAPGPGSGEKHGDNLLLTTENRCFTYKELQKFTNNFKWFIGKGGFGLVYYGRLEDDTEVAVKMRSESSSHGIDEFIAEVQSLKKVHHKNLVSLIGYCWEGDHLGLVYEYMPKGSLFNHLRGENGAAKTLDWGTRVRVVLEAAQGLDYLHKGCKLPIVHRDVKSSNILLGQNLQAKIADFGLSKAYISDTQTHISTTTAAGTTGYMDPQYYHTGKVTESSDVYSFGVVLLEVATGEPPVVPHRRHGHIVQRVKQKIAGTGDIGLVADARLGGAFDINSMWKLVDTAMMCTADSAAQRPTMAAVVLQLKESLELEQARNMDSVGTLTSNPGNEVEVMSSSFRPSAR